jgi:hypothetical protein
MWKTVFLTLILLIASVLLIAETTFATPWLEGNAGVADTTFNTSSPEVTPSPELPKTNVDQSVDKSLDNQQSAQNKTENQNPAPEKQPAMNAIRPQVANPYNIEAIEKYNQENYGAGN